MEDQLLIESSSSFKIDTLSSKVADSQHRYNRFKSIHFDARAGEHYFGSVISNNRSVVG